MALQIKLNQDPDAVHHDAGLIETMQTKIVDYSSVLNVRKSISIFTYLWEKPETFCQVYFEFLDEFPNQLPLCQLRTIQGSEAGGLADKLLGLLSECNMNATFR